MNARCHNQANREGDRHRFPKCLRGYSLVELMLGVMILGMVIATAFGAMQLGLGMVENSRYNTMATQVLQSEVERLRSMDYATFSALSSSSSFTPQGHFDTAQLDGYTFSRLIEDVKTNQKLLTLDVKWLDNRGMQHNRRFLTYVTKEGLNDIYNESR